MGTLKQAEADLESAEANVEAAAANLRRSKAMQTQTKVAFDRAKGLFAGQLVAQADVDVAEANYLTADANVDSAQAMVRQAKAQVSQKSAAVAVARTNLEYTVIRSPIDGIVVARSVDVGQTVAASLQAPTIFTIAQDLTKMLVYAKIDESDVGRIRAGRHVTFRVDSFPQDQFLGIVREIRMNPTIVQNVVTYDTVIEFDNPELKLFPGMTAYVTIPVATAEKVLKLPNAALRYKPPMAPDAVRALYAKCGIVDGEAAVRESKPNEPRAQTAIVWKLAAAGQLEPIQVTLGITDHTSTEVRSVTAGALRPGEQVVTSSVQSKTLPRRARDPAVIRAEEIHKYYDLGETPVHALRGVSVAVAPGEFVAIMGASGSGKSTFMNILGCLDRPSSGRYFLEGSTRRRSRSASSRRCATGKLGSCSRGSTCCRARRPSRTCDCQRCTARCRAPSAPSAPTRRSTWLGSRTARRTILPNYREGSSSGSRSRARS